MPFQVTLKKVIAGLDEKRLELLDIVVHLEKVTGWQQKKWEHWMNWQQACAQKPRAYLIYAEIGVNEKVVWREDDSEALILFSKTLFSAGQGKSSTYITWFFWHNATCRGADRLFNNA